MDKKKEPMDRIIVEDLLHEAESIDKEMSEAGMGKMPADLKDRIKRNLHEQIDEYEKENAYDCLSEEDKKALELGRKMLEKEASHDKTAGVSGEVVVYRKKRTRTFVTVAIVAVLVIAMGVTSIGGPERVGEMMKNFVGTREIVQVDTNEDNYIVTNNDEEKAYQEIKDVFGVDPVKPQYWPKGTAFYAAEIDEELQTAKLMYECEGEIISYYISSHFTDSSWGLDVEDELIDSYYMLVDEEKVEIKEYKIKKSKMVRYLAKYTYNGLEYCLIGTMDKLDLELLIKNLNFFKN